MKIIISHDVDHLYVSDHFCDLIFPKLWLRSSLYLLRGKINIRTWIFRLLSIFDSKLHRIPELIEFENKNQFHSTFFFGMDNILGMSYKQHKALPWIKYVNENGNETGVHGVSFDDPEKISKERSDFSKLTGKKSFGIRMHYVRFSRNTFNFLSDAGYLYDTSEFNKEKFEIASPYRVGNMWEFPLHIMDAYVLKNGLGNGKKITESLIKQARELKMPYCTILFHDYQFNRDTYPDFYNWYTWLIKYLKSENFSFISYQDAILELEGKETPLKK